MIVHRWTLLAHFAIENRTLWIFVEYIFNYLYTYETEAKYPLSLKNLNTQLTSRP